MKQNKKKMYTTGLVLSGGGARGFAHLGVLQALNEKDIPIDIISGVSAGAIAASFYAAGYSPLQILDFFLEKSYLKYFKLTMPGIGLVKNIALYKLLRDKLPETIEDLTTPTVITITDLNKGEVNYVTSGPLARTVLASTSIPVIFQPVVYKNTYYVDGGLMNNLPVEPLHGKCTQIIACHVNPTQEVQRLGSIFKIAERCFQLAIKEQTEKKIQLCTVFIEPKKLSDIKIFDFKKAPEIFDIGYKSAMEALKDM